MNANVLHKNVFFLNLEVCCTSVSHNLFFKPTYLEVKVGLCLSKELTVLIKFIFSVNLFEVCLN